MIGIVSCWRITKRYKEIWLAESQSTQMRAQKPCYSKTMPARYLWHTNIQTFTTPEPDDECYTRHANHQYEKKKGKHQATWDCCRRICRRVYAEQIYFIEQSDTISINKHYLCFSICLNIEWGNESTCRCLIHVRFSYNSISMR